MADIDSILKDLEASVVAAVKKAAVQYVRKVTADAKAFLKQSKADLKLWAAQYASREITRDDLEFLVRGRKSLIEMKAITAAGMAAADVDRLREVVIQAVIDALSKVIP